jgi:hypothetical protein
VICDQDVIVELYNILTRGIFVDTDIYKNKELSGLTNKGILEKLNSLE